MYNFTCAIKCNDTGGKVYTNTIHNQRYSVTLFSLFFSKWICNVIYLPLSFQHCLVFYLCQGTLPISKISTGSITLCHKQHVALKLPTSYRLSQPALNSAQKLLALDYLHLLSWPKGQFRQPTGLTFLFYPILQPMQIQRSDRLGMLF
jgi:hypothetical protein